MNQLENEHRGAFAEADGTPTGSAVALDDPRVVGAVEEYLAAVEAGQRPDRRNFLARFHEIAEALTKCLDGLEFIQMAAPHLQAPAEDHVGNLVPENISATPLGDYRIVREIGRGGMGIVYEAEQLSLARRVALKVLPFAAVFDPKQLQRFKNEAQAAGQLHHTNIVPVFGVGCERGVHYYAMQFIDGQSLADVIRDLRRVEGRESSDGNRKEVPEVIGDQVTGDEFSRDQVIGDWSAGTLSREYRSPITDRRSPSTPPVGALSTERSTSSPQFFRTVAGLGVQAAEALEHAHSLGVAHRDIKPANLLVDVRGNLWITDFGLAHFHSDAGLTMTGDLVGTLRYMSPEQALAKRVLVDYRTDIYSLGITLYELLTLEPAFDGRDRQELLQQIALEEPRLPRRLNSGIPAELETIVFKAISKSPQARYATAQEMADDLRRFLDDKPIKAKRPTLVERLMKWARRHRPVVVTAAASGILLLVTAVVGLALSNQLIVRERDQKDFALREKGAALKDKEQALASAQAHYNTAEAQRERAEANFKNALEAVNTMLTSVAQNEVTRVPQMQPVRRELLEEAIKFYQKLLEQGSTDAAVRFENAQTYMGLASAYEYLGQPADAELAYGQALDLYQKLADEFPADSDYRDVLAGAHSAFAGRLQKAAGRQDEAVRHYRAALELREKIAAEVPSVRYPWNHARTLHSLGYLLATTGHNEEAEADYRQALKIMTPLPDEFPEHAVDVRGDLAAT